MARHLCVIVIVVGRLIGGGLAQLVGDQRGEMPPPMGISKCTKDGGCELEVGRATLDANWRWIHSMQCEGSQCNSEGNCFDGSAWDSNQCADPEKCAASCALEGVDEDDYQNTYGVSLVPGGLKLDYVSAGDGDGLNVGGRLFFLDTPKTYKLFKLKNREFTFDVDVTNLPCGINGALYFSEMEADGGLGDGNKAGAAYGTGYCDAQCPHDVKFQKGRANVLKWNKTDATGSLGACCAEMDIWEANAKGAALTPHPCEHEGTYICTGSECGDVKKGERYKSVCDKDGCDFNPFRMGEERFFGEGSDFTIDSSKPLTVVTQFLTSDGTDEGDLVEIRRVYVQNGKVIQNPNATILGDKGGNSITQEFCDATKAKFGDPNKHKEKGGLKSMGESLDRGMVLVMSLWDDIEDHMLWLDSEEGRPADMKAHKHGVMRGPCSRSSGVPDKVRRKYADSYVKFYNIMYGEIDSTYTAGKDAKPDALERNFEQNSANEEDDSAQQEPQQQQSQQQHPQQQQEAVEAKQSSTGKCGTAFDQCAGGPDWSGATCCEDGCKCRSHSEEYGQCIPHREGDWTCGGQSSAPEGMGVEELKGHMQQKKFEAHAGERTPRAGPAGAALAAAAGLGLLSLFVAATALRRKLRAQRHAELDGESEGLAAAKEPLEVA